MSETFKHKLNIGVITYGISPVFDRIIGMPIITFVEFGYMNLIGNVLNMVELVCEGVEPGVHSGMNWTFSTNFSRK